MDPVHAGLAKLYKGGELEVQNGSEGYLYRGEIAEVVFTPADEHNGALLTVKLVWNAKADGQRLGGGFAPTNGWDEDTTLEHVCNTDLPSADLDGPNIPNVMFTVGPEGTMRMIIANPYTNEMTVLFPRGGNKLNPNNVRWLPDGPWAKAIAARASGATSEPTLFE